MEGRAVLNYSIVSCQVEEKLYKQMTIQTFTSTFTYTAKLFSRNINRGGGGGVVGWNFIWGARLSMGPTGGEAFIRRRISAESISWGIWGGGGGGGAWFKYSRRPEWLFQAIFRETGTGKSALICVCLRFAIGDKHTHTDKKTKGQTHMLEMSVSRMPK